MGNIFEPDFVDFLDALIQNEVEYVLVGGYAVILHGYNRTTGDLCVWVNPTKSNFINLQKAFITFGLPTDVISESEFLDPKIADVFSFGRPPLALDIMTKVKGLEFMTSFQAAEKRAIEGTAINLIHYQHLIQAKKAAGRYKDLNDIDNLEGV